MPPFSSREDLREGPPCCLYDASLLLRRMALNRVDRTEIEESDPLLFYELQAVCTLCPSKELCVVDLANDPSSDGWREYCPNATAIAALETQQNCGLAGPHGAGRERVVTTKLGNVILRPAKGSNDRHKDELPFPQSTLSR